MRCGKLIFKAKYKGIFRPFWRSILIHASMADSEGYERNPFGQDVFRPMIAYLQNLSEIGKKTLAHIGSVLSDALLSVTSLAIAFN